LCVVDTKVRPDRKTGNLGIYRFELHSAFRNWKVNVENVGRHTTPFKGRERVVDQGWTESRKQDLFISYVHKAT
jgi:hypothetical protein